MIIKGIPYFYISNKGDQVPAALIPDKKGVYYKENFLASQPEFYMHMGKQSNNFVLNISKNYFSSDGTIFL